MVFQNGRAHVEGLDLMRSGNIFSNKQNHAGRVAARLTGNIWLSRATGLPPSPMTANAVTRVDELQLQSTRHLLYFVICLLSTNAVGKLTHWLKKKKRKEKRYPIVLPFLLQFWRENQIFPILCRPYWSIRDSSIFSIQLSTLDHYVGLHQFSFPIGSQNEKLI